MAEPKKPAESVSQETPAAGSLTNMKYKSIDRVSKMQTVGKVFAQIGLYTFLTVMAVVVLFPFYWMLISSLKSFNEYNSMKQTFWPRQIQWNNYAAVFANKDLNLGRLFLNTCIVGIVSTILSLIITVLSAYAFARMEFRGKNFLFGALLATMMIPGELFTVTNFLTVASIRNTYTVLIVPFLVSVFYIYLLRQNFMQIPNELYLAAKVDGTSDLKYLWKVMIPLAAPTLITITILKMMGAWNSYVWPNLVARDTMHTLITVGLRNAQFQIAGTQFVNYPVQMAAVVLVTIPLLLVFIFFRKYIMRGVSRSGIKG